MLTAITAVVTSRQLEKLLLDFFECCSFAVHVDVLVDAGTSEITMAEDRLNVAVVHLQALLGGGVGVPEPVQGDAAETVAVADAMKRPGQVLGFKRPTG